MGCVRGCLCFREEFFVMLLSKRSSRLDIMAGQKLPSKSPGRTGKSGFGSYYEQVRVVDHLFFCVLSKYMFIIGSFHTFACSCRFGLVFRFTLRFLSLVVSFVLSSGSFLQRIGLFSIEVVKCVEQCDTIFVI